MMRWQTVIVPTMDDVAGHLANNIRQLREMRGMTQQQMAKLGGVPRPTWANLESGAANPTLSVLTKVAAALQVSLEELVSPPRASSKFYAAASLAVRQRGRVTVRKLLPENWAFSTVPGAPLALRVTVTVG